MGDATAESGRQGHACVGARCTSTCAHQPLRARRALRVLGLVAAAQIIYLCHQFGMSVGIATSIRVSTLLGGGDPAGAKRARYDVARCAVASPSRVWVVLSGWRLCG